jgi:hypothetical protein
MRPIAKAGLVVAGYIAAFALAWAVSVAYIALTPHVDRNLYQGMTAFGDGLVFLWAFGLAACVPTAAALYFLRPYPKFWRVLSLAAIVIAATAALAAVPGVMWGPLRVLIAPAVGVALLVCAVFAPNRSARMTLIAATATEAAVFVYVVAGWMASTR